MVRLEDALARQAAAQAELDAATAEVEQATALPEAPLIRLMIQIDNNINLLQQERKELEVKILRSRIIQGTVVNVTVREAAMITGLAEMTIRAMANPKRAKKLNAVYEYTDTTISRTMITVASLEKLGYL